MAMDTGTRHRLMLGFLANWFAKLGYSLIQFIQVPFFLHFWSVPLYGEWVIVTTITYNLSMSNIGFGTVAGNEMTMMVARDDREAALRCFQSCWWLIFLICIVTASAGAVLLYFLPVSERLRLHEITPADSKWIIGYLGVSILFGQLEQLLQAAYRSAGRYSYGIVIKGVTTVAAFLAMLIPVALGGGPRLTALVFAAANIAGTIVLGLFVRRDIPWIRFGWSHAQFAEIRRLAPLAVAMMGVPLGLAFNLQGTVMVVGYALGPIAVVTFSTARQVSRIAVQLAQMVQGTFEPEFSRSFAQHDLPLVRLLHRRACQAALIISTSLVVGIIGVGPWFLNHWTGGHVPPSRPLLTLLLMVVIVYSLWSTSFALLTATSRHRDLAGIYMVATALTLIATYLLAVRFGLLGAAASLVFSEIVMCLFVLPASLRLSDDTIPGFCASLLTTSPSLHPLALLRRLRRTRQPVEN